MRHGTQEAPPSGAGSPSASGDGAVQRYLQRSAPLCLALVTVAGAILRIRNLGDKSLWLDEANIFWMAQGTLPEILEQNTQHNSAPPLFVMLMSLVLRVGTSEAALRSLACAAGIALIPAVYLLARRYVEKPWALAAAALAAVSPTQVVYSQQVREYSLAALLAALLTYAVQAFLDRPERRQAWVLAAVTVLALFTQYGLGLLAAALAGYSLIRLVRTNQPPPVWRRWALVQGLGLGCVASLVWLGLAEQLADGKGGVTRSIRYLASGYWDPDTQSALSFVLNRTEGLVGFAFPGAAFGLLLLAGCLGAARDRGTRQAAMVFVASLAVAIGAALVHAYPYGGIRQSLVLTPMFYVMAAVGVATIGLGQGRWQPLAAAGLLLAATGLAGIRAHYWWAGEEPIRPLIAEYVERRAPEDELYVSGRTVAGFRYYNRNRQLGWHAGLSIRRTAPDSAIAQLDSLIRRPGRLWLLFSDLGYERAQLVLDRMPQDAKLDTVRRLGRSGLFLVE